MAESEEDPKIYGYVVRIPLEQVTLEKIRHVAGVTDKALRAVGVTEPGLLKHRCEPSRWLDFEDTEPLFMPAEVLLYREGLR